MKAFISHGGIFGTYEAIHTATPVVGIPFMYDQFTNVNILQEKGVAIYLDYDSLDYETIHNALKNIINDHRYYVCSISLHYYMNVVLPTMILFISNIKF